MSDVFAKRVSAAAGAGWWTLLVFVIWYVLAWIMAWVLMRSEPQWVLDMLGARALTWEKVSTIYLWFFGALKTLVFLGLIVVVWLSLWARRLKRIEP